MCAKLCRCSTNIQKTQFHNHMNKFVHVINCLKTCHAVILQTFLLFALITTSWCDARKKFPSFWHGQKNKNVFFLNCRVSIKQNIFGNIVNRNTATVTNWIFQVKLFSFRISSHLVTKQNNLHIRNMQHHSACWLLFQIFHKFLHNISFTSNTLSCVQRFIRFKQQKNTRKVFSKLVQRCLKWSITFLN